MGGGGQKGEAGGEAGPRRRCCRCCGPCCGWCCCVWKWLLLCQLSNTFGSWSVWDWAWDPQTTCQHPAQPPNQTGIKVLIYGPQKTGTKSMTKALHRLGLDQTYHSEDFVYAAWTGIADEFWRRPENGGARYHATTWEPAKKGLIFDMTDSDLRVLRGLSTEELAASISRCRIDALPFDGMENLFWPVYNVSPGAKVVSLNWRTWQEYHNSEGTWAWQIKVALTLAGFLTCPVHLLPWSALLLPIMELLSGNQLHNYLSNGGPPFTEVEQYVVSWWRYNAGTRRWFMNVASGLERIPKTEAEYSEGFEEVRRVVPAEDLLEWDMRRHGMPELCRFLGITDVPACETKGTLPKGINILWIEREQWRTVLGLTPLWLVLHWANWKIAHLVWFLATWPIRKLCRCCCGCGNARAKVE